MNNTYLAICIGPVYKTISSVSKTRELWAASFTFSLLSKGIVEAALDKDDSCLVSPYYINEDNSKDSSNSENENDLPGVGIYPELIFLQCSEKLNIDNWEEIKDAAIAHLSTNTGIDTQFLKAYFQIYAIQYEVSESENPILKGGSYLNSYKLQQQWQLIEPANDLVTFFRNVNNKSTEKFLTKFYNQKDVIGQVRFESLIEIATRPLRDKNLALYKDLVKQYCYTDKEIDNKSSDFVSELQNDINEEENKPFKNYHKYVAFVYADGDRIGKYLRYSSAENYRSFSEKMSSWGLGAATKITNYQGVPIYVGGDDLLFVCPVVGIDQQNILDLCYEINQDFKSEFQHEVVKDEEGKQIIPSLSFGVSISYYKFPMSEAIKQASNLMYQAKKDRNAIALSLLKHSGTELTAQLKLDQHNKIFTTFNDLSKSFTDKQHFINSIIYHFKDNKPVYQLIAKQPNKVLNYLNNNFEDESQAIFRNKISSFVCEVFQQKKTNTTEELDEAINFIYESLRLLKFLNGMDDDSK